MQVQRRPEGELGDQRLQEPVGDDDDDQHRDAHGRSAGAPGDEHGERTADDGAEVRDVVGHPGDEAERCRQRDADDERAHEDHHSVEQAHDGASVDVPAEEARAVGEHGVGDRLRHRRHVLRRPAADLASLDQHPHEDVDADEDAEDEAGDAADQVADRAGRAARHGLEGVLRGWLWPSPSAPWTRSSSSATSGSSPRPSGGCPGSPATGSRGRTGPPGRCRWRAG